MEEKSKTAAELQKTTQERPRCLEVAAKGISTGADFARFMSGMMSDLIESRITPQVGNAACNAGGKLLKVVEMQYKYGTQGNGNERILQLTTDGAV